MSTSSDDSAADAGPYLIEAGIPDRPIELSATPASRRDALGAPAFLTGLAAVSPLGPIFLIVFTLYFYVVNTQTSWALIAGLAAGGTLWAVAGAVAMPFVSIRSANRPVYRDLASRTETLLAQVDTTPVFPMVALAAGDERQPSEPASPPELQRQVQALARELGLRDW